LCEDEQAEALANLIARAARTGQDEAGWVYVTDVLIAIQVAGHSSSHGEKSA